MVVFKWTFPFKSNEKKWRESKYRIVKNFAAIFFSRYVPVWFVHVSGSDWLNAFLARAWRMACLPILIFNWKPPGKIIDISAGNRLFWNAIGQIYIRPWMNREFATMFAGTWWTSTDARLSAEKLYIHYVPRIIWIRNVDLDRKIRALQIMKGEEICARNTF